MAAYAALVSLMNDLDDIKNHPGYSFSFDNKQITSLRKNPIFLIDFLETNDSHGCSREALESRIASAAHAAHDVIESHVVDQIHAGSALCGKARSYFLLDLQKAIHNMDFVQRKAKQFKAKSGLLKAEEPSYSAPASISRENNIVGLDDVRVQLMDMLTGKPSDHRQVIPLVGMGGIGKTTLAKNVYQHLLVKQHFDVRLWITISQQYSVETIFTQLFGESKSTTDGNVSGEELHKKLWGRRYLIVLDDMWSIEAWNEIQMFMPDNGNGSCVIVTTRLLNLAAHLSSSPFEMNFLDEDKSWELFCGEAFGQEKCPLQLENIGKNVVKRCRGLPLSITVIGGHLRKSSRAIEYWEKVGSLMNPISSSVEDDQCLQIISLSYHHLPVFLKPCFLYMGIYEEDARIDAVELIKYWIAEGFLKPKQSLSLEEVAEEYLKDLIERNLVLVRKRRWNGKVEKCGIHDSVRELCLKIGMKEKFMSVEDTGRERRIEMRLREWKHRVILGILKIEPLVRSRMGRGECYSRPWLDFRFMRVSSFICVEAAHFQLLNLRYLHFYLYNQATESKRCCILSSVSLFWNVKTLIIQNYSESSVSYEIWEMPQLRHLEFCGICLPSPLPSEEECIVLQNLHTLLGVVDFKLTEEVCKRMPNIKNLYMKYYHFPLDLEEVCSDYYCPYNLGRFNKLESLECWFYDDDSKWRDLVLSTFPSSLKELSLHHSQLHWDDLTMMSKSLPHLEALKLASVNGFEWNLVEEFPCLKKLKISSCSDLIYWNASSSHFPILENLHVYSTPELSEIPLEIGDIPTLRLIKLDECSVSAAISAMRIVVEQESLENQDIQLDIQFWETEEETRFLNMVKEHELENNSLRLH